MHFSSAGIHTGQSAVFDTNVRNGIPTSSFCFRLCARHGLQAPAFHLPGWRGRNTILYEDNHKGLIDIPLPNVCTSLPCSALWSAGHNAGIPAPIDREELRSHIFHWWSQHPEMVIPDSHAVTSLDGLLSPCVHLFCWHTHRCDVLLLLPSQVRNDIFWKWHPVTVSNPDTEFRFQFLRGQIMVDPSDRKPGKICFFLSLTLRLLWRLQFQILRLCRIKITDCFCFIEKTIVPFTSRKQIWLVSSIFSEDLPKRFCLPRITCSIRSCIFHSMREAPLLKHSTVPAVVKEAG